MKNRKIRTAMITAGITQGDLAKILGVSGAEMSYMLKYELSVAEQYNIIDRIKKWQSERDTA